MDYPSIKALAAVVEEQSFEQAAQKLHVTQSAVSQRISALEGHYGQKLLYRTLPYRVTPFGEKLVSHLRKIVSLEDELTCQLTNQESLEPLRIALNIDSLDGWASEISLRVKEELGYPRLEILTADQDQTLSLLRNGQVDLAVASENKPLSQGQYFALGNLCYHMVATKKFKADFFPKSMTKKSLAHAPAILFNRHDNLHAEYLAKYLKYEGSFPHSWCPTTKAFAEAIRAGLGYGMLPNNEAKRDLARGKIVSLRAEVWKAPLYLHYWQICTNRVDKVADILISLAKKGLR